MANVYAVDYAKRFSTVPAKLTNVATQGGRLRVLYDTYTVVTATLQNDVLYFGRLPPDCKVWEVAIQTSATLGTSATIDVGWQAVSATATAANKDLDGWHNGISGETALSFWKVGGASTATANKGIAIAPTSIPDEANIVATLLGVDPNAGVVISLMCHYSID
jgi:translation initiation factor 6 (eIF-6)